MFYKGNCKSGPPASKAEVQLPVVHESLKKVILLGMAYILNSLTWQDFLKQDAMNRMLSEKESV